MTTDTCRSVEDTRYLGIPCEGMILRARFSLRNVGVNCEPTKYRESRIEYSSGHFRKIRLAVAYEFCHEDNYEEEEESQSQCT